MLLEQVGRPAHAAQRKTASVPRRLLLYIRTPTNTIRWCFPTGLCLPNHLPIIIIIILLEYQCCSAAAPYEGRVHEEGNERLTLTGKRRKVTRTNVFSSLRCLNHCVQDLQGKKNHKGSEKLKSEFVFLWKLHGCAFIITNWEAGRDQTPFNQNHVNFFSCLSSSSSSVGSTRSTFVNHHESDTCSLLALYWEHSIWNVQN